MTCSIIDLISQGNIKSFFLKLNLDNKLFRDYIEKYHLNMIIGNEGSRDEYSILMNVVKESWEEASGRKLN